MKDHPLCSSFFLSRQIDFHGPIGADFHAGQADHAIIGLRFVGMSPP